MHLFMACLSTETNSFSPLPTDMAGFEAFYLRHGTATSDPPNLMTEALHAWRARAEALGWRVTESLSAVAEPAGPTTADCHARLAGEILDDLRAAGGADIVLLQLHGAMIAEGEDDCEGALAEAVRRLCPGAVIGVALDLHCHPSGRLLSAADLVVCFKEYPHDDATPRARELFELARRTAEGDVAPVMATFDCRMIGLYPTKEGAMARFVARMRAAEDAPGVLSVSLAHGFPWGDVARAGTRTLVVADGDGALARREGERLGRAFFDLREEVTRPVPSLGASLDEALAESEGPVVLADMSDNPGAGAPGDATHVLHEAMRRGVHGLASGLYFDPEAVARCRNAGIGAELTLPIGGKLEPMSGAPAVLPVRVMAIAEDAGQHLGPGLEPMGTAVWLRGPLRLDLVVNDLRTQVYHPEAFEQLGIRLANKRLVVVKSLFHFHAPFARIARRIVLAAPPGRTRPDIGAIRFRNRSRDYWPAVADPFDAGPPKAL